MTYRQIGIQLLSFALLVLVTAPSFVASATMPGSIVTCSGALDAGSLKACTICDIAKVAQNVVNTAIYIAVFLSAILFAWAGFLYLTNITNPGGLDRARTIFGSVLTALLIVLSAWLVIDVIMKTLTPNSGAFGPWNKIC